MIYANIRIFCQISYITDYKQQCPGLSRGITNSVIENPNLSIYPIFKCKLKYLLINHTYPPPSNTKLATKQT